MDLDLLLFFDLRILFFSCSAEFWPLVPVNKRRTASAVFFPPPKNTVVLSSFFLGTIEADPPYELFLVRRSRALFFGDEARCQGPLKQASQP